LRRLTLFAGGLGGRSPENSRLAKGAATSERLTGAAGNRTAHFHSLISFMQVRTSVFTGVTNSVGASIFLDGAADFNHMFAIKGKRLRTCLPS
jgi:hypothetical protein